MSDKVDRVGYVVTTNIYRDHIYVATWFADGAEARAYHDALWARGYIEGGSMDAEGIEARVPLSVCRTQINPDVPISNLMPESDERYETIQSFTSVAPWREADGCTE